MLHELKNGVYEATYAPYEIEDRDTLLLISGEDIFVHASNSSAMMWHVRQSARNFRYYPSESFTNFFASIAHSLSHIEE